MAKLDDTMIARIVELRQSGKTQPDIAHELRVSVSTVNKYLKKAAAEGALGFKPVLPGFAITQTSTDGDKTWVKQQPRGEEFEVPEGHKVHGVSALVDSNGNTIQQWIKTKEEQATVQLTREAVMEAVAEWRGKAEILAPPAGCDPHRIALYPYADLHLGMLAWGRDSERAWDLAIAQRELIAAHSELIQLTPPTQTAILLDLGDQFHMNDQTNATPLHKHRLDVDGRFPKVAKAAVKMRRTMIELALQRHERVIYRGLRGNHDPEAQMWLSIGLEMAFENDPRVHIDTDPGDFWHHKFGKVFLFANHGHKVKPDRLPEIMASDHADVWGATEFRYAFSGHIHQQKSGEKMKVIWETLRTPTPGDNYAHTGGWRSGHELTSITYSAETGQRHRQYVPV